GSEHVCVRELPILEPRGCLDGRVTLEVDPARAAHVDEERLVAGRERAIRDEEEAAPARPAEELPARRGQEVAAELRDRDAGAAGPTGRRPRGRAGRALGSAGRSRPPAGRALSSSGRASPPRASVSARP